MKNWRDAVVGPKSSILDALAILEKTSSQIILVADGDGRLQGTITDGDVRRALLRGTVLSQPVMTVMNASPLTVGVQTDLAEACSIMAARGIRHLPVIDDDGRLTGLHSLDEMLRQSTRLDNLVVLMAGGEGRRLRPHTEETPKPLLTVGGRPILETILENFVGAGFHRFLVSVNYKADMICDVLGDGSRWNVDIEYLKEDRAMGTAGCLGLLPERPEHPFFVMNADLLTKVNFQSLLDYHTANGADATMCVREYHMEVPYGVVDLDDEDIKRIVEKPVTTFFVNAGVYVLDPKCLNYLDSDAHCDMTELFQRLIANDGKATSFPIHEYWLDIGRHSDLDRARSEYGSFFA